MVILEAAPFLAPAAALLIGGIAEALHHRRCRALAPLAFGPTRRPAVWARAAPALRVLGLAALAWGLAALLTVDPKVHKAAGEEELEERHLLLVLDVSPSMRLKDSGPKGDQSRMQRARELMGSFFRRVPMAAYRSTVIAVYNGAKPVVVGSRDLGILRNILGDLPMHYAFRPGKTELLSGLREAAKVARPWKPKSAVLVLISDGDTVPPTGMPVLPPSIADVLVVGVGDPVNGRFIDGRQSRQDRSALRQIAVRLRGRYHNGNARHLSSTVLGELGRSGDASPLERLSRREYALIAVGASAAWLALLPLLLHLFGAAWRPGARPRSTQENKPAVARGVTVERVREGGIP